MSDFDEWFTRYVRELRELGMHAYALESDLRNVFEAGKRAAHLRAHAYALESDLRNAFEAGKHAAVSARHA